MERSVDRANIFGVSAILENRQDNLNKQTLDQINYFLENIAKFDQKNQYYIQQDFENEKEGTVKEYVDFHIEE